MSRSRSRSPARGYRGGDRDYASRQGSSQYERDSRHRRYDDRERYSDEQGYRQQSRQTDRRYDHEASDSRHDRHDRPRASYRPVREEVDPPRRAPNNDGCVRVKSRPAYVEDRSPHANDKPAGTGSKGQMDDVSNDKDGKEGEDKDDDDDDAEAQMAAMMGFGGFGSTKGEKVKGNGAAGAISKPAKRVEYRQYMNRAGGFNRPLDEKSAV